MLVAYLDAGTASILIGLPALVALVLVVWAWVDMIRQPQEAWESTGQSRVLWLSLLIFPILCGLAWITAIIYLVLTRPKLNAATAAHNA